ncbi:DUF6207 family protein [Streptomyces sp. NPDC056061]|uniref:DUF6207 family protein n=1 Tax=Streptomyces sp. NPDC056061 TaxID=3345700 RepID=UPI0035D90804
MEPIHEQHLSEPGLVVLDITAADEATVHAVAGDGLAPGVTCGNRDCPIWWVHASGHTCGPVLEATVRPTVQPPLGATLSGASAASSRPKLL